MSLTLVVFKESRCEHPDDFGGDWTHLTSKVLDIAVDFDLAFSAIKRPLHTFAGLYQVINVLHWAAYDAKVVFGNHRHVEGWVNFEELLVLKMFVR